MSGNTHQVIVRQNIQEGAELSVAYLLMNILAATIASYGLLANSPAVVIGAMIVAMLLGPIAGIALALVDSDMKFLWKSTFSLVAGAAVVMATALVIGIIHRNIPLTHEIMARTEPNLLDLMVALAGGAACAYATVSPRLSVAFVGNYLVDVRFDETVSGKLIVRAVVRGPNPPNQNPVELRIRFVQALIINRDGPLYQDIEFGTVE